MLTEPPVDEGRVKSPAPAPGFLRRIGALPLIRGPTIRSARVLRAENRSLQCGKPVKKEPRIALRGTIRGPIGAVPD